MLRPRATTLTVLASDLAALFLSFMLAYLVRIQFPPYTSLYQNFQLLPLLLLFVPIYAAFSLYPGFLLAGPEKLKLLSIASTLGVLFLCGMFFMDQKGMLFSRFILLFFWIMTLITVPFFRYCLKKICGRLSWWGYPAILFGKSEFVEKVAGQLQAAPWIGYKSIGILTLDEEARPENGFESSALDGDKRKAVRQLMAFKQKYNPVTAIVVMEGLKAGRLQCVTKLVKANLLHIIMLPEERFSITVSTSPAMFCSHVAISMRQKLLSPYRLHIKRCIDLLVITAASLPALLLFLLICAAIALDSRGGVLYRHKRIGQGGKEIKIWKFRTMCKNADDLLEDYLRKNPALKEEWSDAQKLKHDPRITRVGHILRKTSMDELPQIINVLAGEMSLVGPRPIVEQEIKKYGEAFETYIRVKPGITGIWQTSGRNGVTYADRVSMDEHYVANWSVWMDIYTLIRTIPEVIKGSGAY